MIIITAIILVLIFDKWFNIWLYNHGYKKAINPKLELTLKQLIEKEEVQELIHRAVNDSHCSQNRVKHPNSNECAGFVNEWVHRFKNK